MKRSELKKEDLQKIVNISGLEEVICYDLNSKTCILCDDVKAIERQAEGKILIFPYDTDLYSWGSTMASFIEENQIEIPNGCKCWRYLCESGWNYAFYDYKDQMCLKALKKWLRKHKIKDLKIAA